MSTSPYNQYTGSKPPPKWLGYTLFWFGLVPVMLGYVGWGCIKLATSRPNHDSQAAVKDSSQLGKSQ